MGKDPNWTELNPPLTFSEFSRKKLIKPGTVIETIKPNKIFKTDKLLIGHINEQGGYCDDCSICSETTFVWRYKYVDF